MTTATAASPPATPAAVEFALLQSWLASGSALQLPLHQIECLQQAKGREVHRLLLQAHLEQRGNGDLGPALCLQQPDGEVFYSHRRLGTRSLTTVFGTVELVRMGYSRPGEPGIFPLDRALTLPARSFSYELQRRLVKAAVQNPFLDSVQTIADLTGVSVSKRSLEQILPDAAQDFDAVLPAALAGVRHRHHPGGRRRLQGYSHGQAARRPTNAAADERSEGQQEAHGHGRGGLHPYALGAYSTTGRGKLVPHLPPESRGCAGPASVPSTNGYGPV